MHLIEPDLAVFLSADAMAAWLELVLFAPLLVLMLRHAEFDAYCVKEGRP